MTLAVNIGRDGAFDDNVEVHRLGPFTDGVRYDEAHELVPLTALAEMQNVEIGSGGELVKRRGYSRLVSAPESGAADGLGVGMIRFTAADIGHFYSTNGKFYTKSLAGNAWIDRTSGVTISSDSDDFLVWAEAFGSGGFFTDGVNAPFKWSALTSDIETAGISGRFTRCRGVTWFDNRLWWWNTNDSEGQIWFSNLLNIEEINATSWFDIKAPILCVESFGDRLYLHTQTQVWVIYRTGDGQTPYGIDGSIPYGAISPRAAVNLPTGEQIIIRQDGVYRWSGGAFPDKISGALEERYWPFLNKKKRELWGLLVDIDRSQVWCFLTYAESQTINHVMIYDYRYNRWFGPHTIAMGAWAYANEQILTTGYGDGLVYVQQDGLNDDEEAIEASLSTSAQSPMAPSVTVQWLHGRAFFQGQNLETDLLLSQHGPEVGFTESRRKLSVGYPSLGNFVIGRSAIGSDDNLQAVEFDVNGRGFSCRIDVENDLANQSFNLQFIDLLYTSQGLKLGGQS